ncbi:MAG: hypothetical protein ACYTGW_08505 [Planctomycetota bacterium]|jgi:hypothetical protein
MGTMGRLFRILFLVLPLAGLGASTVGCTTTSRSGQAVEAWLGGALNRLRTATDPGRLVNPEIRRARHLIAQVPGYPSREFDRTRPLWRGALRQVGDVSGRTQQLPGKVTAAADRNLTNARRRVQHLVEPDGLVRETLDPGRHATAVRRICERLPTVLGLDRPILPGPGDPDRQTVAHPTGRQETWVEKILRRVRL